MGPDTLRHVRSLVIASVAAAFVVAALWLDFSFSLQAWVAARWQALYAIIAELLASRAGMTGLSAMMGAFVVVDVTLVGAAFASAFAWSRFRFDRSEIAWLPVWLAPVWVATGLSGGTFASKARAVAAYLGTPTNQGGYQRAWQLIMPETLLFLGAVAVVAVLGWWLGRHLADAGANRQP